MQTMYPYRKKNYCSVCPSHNSHVIDPRTQKRIRQHRFPNPFKESERCSKWIENLKLGDCRSEIHKKRVCSLHFDVKAYNNPNDISTSTLLSSAVPMVYVESPTQTRKSRKKHFTPGHESGSVVDPHIENKQLQRQSAKELTSPTRVFLVHHEEGKKLNVQEICEKNTSIVHYQKASAFCGKKKQSLLGQESTWQDTSPPKTVLGPAASHMSEYRGQTGLHPRLQNRLMLQKAVAQPSGDEDESMPQHLKEQHDEDVGNLGIPARESIPIRQPKANQACGGIIPEQTDGGIPDHSVLKRLKFFAAITPDTFVVNSEEFDEDDSETEEPLGNVSDNYKSINCGQETNVAAMKPVPLVANSNRHKSKEPVSMIVTEQEKNKAIVNSSSVIRTLQKTKGALVKPVSLIVREQGTSEATNKALSNIFRGQEMINAIMKPIMDGAETSFPANNTASSGPGVSPSSCSSSCLTNSTPDLLSMSCETVSTSTAETNVYKGTVSRQGELSSKERKKSLCPKVECKEFICCQCSKTYRSVHSLKKHIRQHTIRDFGPYPCEICGKRFGLEKDLSNHKILDHFSYECDICGKKFLEESGVQRHKNTYHIDRRMFVCRICNQTIQGYKKLCNHLKGHERQQQKFVCDVCGKEFARQSLLNRHLRMHKNKDNRHFQCERCGVIIKGKANFERHWKIHVQSFLCMCEVCGKKFTTNDAYKRHVLTHKGPPPFKCDLCDKGYFAPRDLQKHRKKVHEKLKSSGDKPS